MHALLSVSCAAAYHCGQCQSNAVQVPPYLAPLQNISWLHAKKACSHSSVVSTIGCKELHPCCSIQRASSLPGLSQPVYCVILGLPAADDLHAGRHASDVALTMSPTPIVTCMQACRMVHHAGSRIQEVQQLLSSKTASQDTSQDEALDVSTSGREQEACGHALPLDRTAEPVQCNSKAHMLALVHCKGYSKPVLVLGALGVQALLKSPAVTEEAR